ncbi:MAG TPA: ThuA domain-containing protein, partial [Chryseolinea sp.]|nr:ThuA domain-containing protein [Chryseolinea sp.]
MRTHIIGIYIVILSGLLSSCGNPNQKSTATGPRKIEILFLGHASEHHNSALFMPMLSSVLSKEGINFTYNDDPSVLNEETLSNYDGLMIYANHETITPEQEAALMNFVADGKGFIPVHCASFCFQNSPKYIGLVGGQFMKHDT